MPKQAGSNAWPDRSGPNHARKAGSPIRQKNRRVTHCIYADTACLPADLRRLPADAAMPTELGPIIVGDRVFMIITQAMLDPAGLHPSSETTRFTLRGETFLVIETAAGCQPSRSLERDPERLTARELQIVLLVAQDRVDREIADTLGIEVHTVRTHLRRVFSKLGVHNKAAMIYRCAAWLNLLDAAFVLQQPGRDEAGLNASAATRR